MIKIIMILAGSLIMISSAAHSQLPETYEIISPLSCNYESVVVGDRIDNANFHPNQSGLYSIKRGEWLSHLATNITGRSGDYRLLRAINNYVSRNHSVLGLSSKPEHIFDSNILREGQKIYLANKADIEDWHISQGNRQEPMPPLIFISDAHIRITGSSTLFLLHKHVAECYRHLGYQGTIAIGSTGSGSGLRALCAGQAEIAGVSAEYSETDLPDECQHAQTRNLIKVPIALDGIALVVNRSNEITNTTIDGREGIQQFYEDKTLLTLKRFVPSSESGTRRFLLKKLNAGSAVNRFFGMLCSENDQECINAIPSEDDLGMMREVAHDPNAMAVASHAYFYSYKPFNPSYNTLKTLKINNIELTAESIDSNYYPFHRKLYLYTTHSRIQRNPQLCSFLRYYYNVTPNVITSLGYFPLNNYNVETTDLETVCPLETDQ